MHQNALLIPKIDRGFEWYSMKPWICDFVCVSQRGREAK